MKMKASAITAATLLALTAQSVSAAEAVGYNVVAVPANSDAVVSVPFTQDAEASFTVNAVTDADSFTVNESLAADTYDSSYYVRFTSGNGEGFWSTISDNGSGGFDLSDTNVLSNVAGGDSLTVYAHHTLGSVFPSSLEGTTFDSSTQIMLPNTASEGINKAAKAFSYQENGLFGNPAGWYDGFTYSDSVVIAPDSFVIVRNQLASGITNIVFGDVLDTDLAAVIPATSGSDDLYLGLYPVDVTLGDLNLEGFGQLIVIDNDASGINKAGKAYTYQASGLFGNPAGWYDGFTYADSTVVPAGTGVILRRSAGASADDWAMNKPY